MALNISQSTLDEADLIVVVDHEGKYQWSSHRPAVLCAGVLRGIADDMECEST